MKKSIILAALLSLPLAHAAEAGCVIKYVRTACPGMEDQSYSKCGGTKSCDVDDAASTEAACIAAAKNACPNSRLTITKSKVITAKFDGKALNGGGNFCAANRPDFNKCAK